MTPGRIYGALGWMQRMCRALRGPVHHQADALPAPYYRNASMNAILDRLSELGISLPDPPKPVASYVPAAQSGSLLYVSGQLPFRDGELMTVGPVPSAVSIESAMEGARWCAINGLAVAKQALDGDLDRLRRVVRVGAFVQSDDRFDAQPKVANGASDLLVEVLGDDGRHARAAVGVNALPLDTSVEVEFVFEID